MDFCFAQSERVRMLIIKSDALWNREKWDHSGNRKMAKRIAHVRQVKTIKPMGRDSSMRYKWSRKIGTYKTNKSSPCEK